jgi:hypothetical protein
MYVVTTCSNTLRTCKPRTNVRTHHPKQENLVCVCQHPKHCMLPDSRTTVGAMQGRAIRGAVFRYLWVRKQGHFGMVPRNVAVDTLQRLDKLLRRKYTNQCSAYCSRMLAIPPNPLPSTPYHSPCTSYEDMVRVWCRSQRIAFQAYPLPSTSSPQPTYINGRQRCRSGVARI